MKILTSFLALCVVSLSTFVGLVMFEPNTKAAVLNMGGNETEIRNGIDGQDGANGIDGLNGIDGQNGRDGVNGLNGADGKDGVRGTMTHVVNRRTYQFAEYFPYDDPTMFTVFPMINDMIVAPDYIDGTKVNLFKIVDILPPDIFNDFYYLCIEYVTRLTGTDGKDGIDTEAVSSLFLQNSPHTWEVGVEYEFADGTFGQRFVSTTVINNGAIKLLTQTPISPNAKIISCGGYVYFSTYPNNAENGRIALGQTHTYYNGANGNGIIYASSALYIEKYNSSPNEPYYFYINAYTVTGVGYAYDVWVRYTK